MVCTVKAAVLVRSLFRERTYHIIRPVAHWLWSLRWGADV